MDLQGRVAVVTGGASGIGRATVAALGGRGCRTAVWDLQTSDVGDLGLAVDVGDPDAVRAATERTVAELGGLDVMVANAAVGGYGNIVDLPDAAWRRVLRVDLDGVFYCLRDASRVMRDRGGGRIVVVSSRDGLRPEPGMSAYDVAKAGVIHLAQVAALELARHNVLVNVVCPGPTDTPMLDAVRRTPGLEEALATQPPLGRLGTPEEIAEAIVFAASHDWMTGSVLVVDGGSCLRGELGIRDAVEKLAPGLVFPAE